MSAEIKQAIHRSGMFEGCDDGLITQMIAQAHRLSAPKGKILFSKDEAAERFYIIHDGWVKLYRETVDGAQAIIDILTSGHVFGDTAIFQDDVYPYHAEIAEPATIISIPIHVLKKAIETNPKLALNMMASMARYRRHQDQEIENRTLKSAPQRIGCFLLRLIDQSQTGPVSIQLPYDKTLVASRLGMQPETFSRALSKLKESISLDIKGSTIDIKNVSELVNYACSACSSEFPCHDLKPAFPAKDETKKSSY